MGGRAGIIVMAALIGGSFTWPSTLRPPDSSPDIALNAGLHLAVTFR
jgi:hypothetical protein